MWHCNYNLNGSNLLPVSSIASDTAAPEMPQNAARAGGGTAADGGPRRRSSRPGFRLPNLRESVPGLLPVPGVAHVQLVHGAVLPDLLSGLFAAKQRRVCRLVLLSIPSIQYHYL